MKGTEMNENEIHAAMAAAFAAMPDIPKTRFNPQHRSKYMNLDDIVHAVRPVLAAHGLYFRQSPEPIEGDYVAVRTVFGHKSGGEIDAGVTVVPARPIAKRGEDPKPANAHSFGSALTYAKRYGLSAALGIAEEDDDDGNRAASGGSDGGSPNGHGRPVNTIHPGKDVFWRRLLEKTGKPHDEAGQIAKQVMAKLGIDPESKDDADWKRAVEAVNENADLVAWVGGAA